MADNEVQNWAEIEAGYWTDTVRARVEEDRSMSAKFETRTGPIRQRLTELVDEREKLSLALQEVKKQYEAVEAQLDSLGLQFEEAKQVTAADRERKDESARAWFNYNKTRNTASQGDTQPQETGGNKHRRESKASRPNGHAQTPSTNGFSAVNGNAHGNGKVHQSASVDSSPLSEPPDVSPPDMHLTGAEIFDSDGNRLGTVRRLNLENRFTRQIVQLPVQRHVVIRPGRKFTQETMDSVYEPTDAKGAKWLSCMIQATGEEQDTPCTSCLNRAGTWVGCVIVGGEDFPRCANCEWNRQGCSGSSYHQDRSKDPDLQQNTYHTAPESPYPEYSAQNAREDTSSGGFTPVNGGVYHKPPVPDTAASSGPQSKRTSLPGGKKGARKSLPNMATSGRDKENVEPNDETMGYEGETRIDAVDPGPEITKETLALQDNGKEYTEPEIMRGVPLERVTPEHPYWDPKWEELDEIVQQKLDSWKKKLEECLAQNKNRFLAGRQVNRGTTTMNFLHKTDFHPYQLVGKKWISKGLISYDTIFRLAQVIEELPKLGVNCTPVEWVRQRMHELYTEQGEQFSLARTVHELYHDPKLRALRTKAGFGNIGRPSGVKKGASAKEAKEAKEGKETKEAKEAKAKAKDTGETPNKKRRRQSSGSVKQDLKQEGEPQGSPGPGMTMTPRNVKKQRTSHGSRPGSSRANGLGPDGADDSPTFTHRPKSKLAVQKDSKQDGLGYEGYTSTDSFSHDSIMAIDFRITQLKTRGNATNMNHTQYWHWVDTDKHDLYFEHQVLRTVNPPSWGVYKEPLNFNLHLKELDSVEYSPQKECLKIVVHTKPIANVAHRGDVMALFKRERTLRRFLHFLGEKGVALVKRPR